MKRIHVNQMVFLLVVIVSLGGGVIAGFADHKPKHKGGFVSPNEIPVTIAFRCPLGVGCNLNSPDAIRGDGLLGDYTHGELGVRAVFVGTGNVVLDLRDSQRSFVMDFGDSLTAPFDGPVDEKAFAATAQATDVTGELIENRLLGMAVGQVAESLFAVNFSDPTGANFSWRLRFDPLVHPETTATKVQVTRTSTDTWEIVAGPDDVAALLKVTTRGRPSVELQGDFSMPFGMTVTCLEPGTCSVPAQ